MINTFQILRSYLPSLPSRDQMISKTKEIGLKALHVLVIALTAIPKAFHYTSCQAVEKLREIFQPLSESNNRAVEYSSVLFGFFFLVPFMVIRFAMDSLASRFDQSIQELSPLNPDKGAQEMDDRGGLQ